jgi:hypothetical protein
MIELHLPKIKKILNTNKVEVQQTDFGYAILKDNWTPSEKADKITISGLDLDLVGRVLHERVLIIYREIPIRSHEEEDQEIVENIGHFDIRMTLPRGKSRIITPGNCTYSVQGPEGFCHGFDLRREGVLYVAKALKPKSVKGQNSFIMPENSYKGDY